MNKRNELVNRIVEIALMAALAFVLDFIQGLIPRFAFTSGGSIGIAMLPIYFLAFRRGFVDGFLAGLIMSFLQLIGNSIYTIPVSNGFLVFAQVALDYFLAYPCVALCGLLIKRLRHSETNKGRSLVLAIGGLIGGLGKFMCHFLSGFIFWGEYCPNDFLGGPVVYSLVYNGSYCFINMILNTIIIISLALSLPKLFLLPNIDKAK